MDIYLKRALDLARLGNGTVAPNPLVGSVAVYKDTIIGEGYHQYYGSAHAEVNCVKSIRKQDIEKLKKSELYVSLEPCCFHGNTPACTDLIIKNNIPSVKVGALDMTPQVKGEGIDILKNHGIEVKVYNNSLAQWMVRIRNTFVQNKRPYIILKYAVSPDGFIGKKEEQVWLTNRISKILVHKWRSEIDAILVGTQTALSDNPALSNRLYFGSSPLRIFVDLQNKVPFTHQLFDGSQNTLRISSREKTSLDIPQFEELNVPNNYEPWVSLLNTYLYENKKSTLMIEGGAQILQTYLKSGMWDEIRLFRTPKILKTGIKAPLLNLPASKEYILGSDKLEVYYSSKNKLI